MGFSRGVLQTVLLVSTSVLGAAAGCVGDDPQGSSITSDASTGGASSSGGASSGSGSSDASLTPDVAAPIVGFCAAQPTATLKFCEDFEAAGTSLGKWTSVPPAVPAGGLVTLTPEMARGHVLSFDITGADSAAPSLFVSKTFDAPVSAPFVLEYDMLVSEHAPAAPGAPYNGFVGASLNGSDLLRFGVAEGAPVLSGGGGGGGKADAELGPERLNPYTPQTPNTEENVRDIGFNGWFHVQVVVGATSTTSVQVLRPNVPPIIRDYPAIGQLGSFAIGFNRGASDRWRVFYDNVLVRSGSL